MKVYGCPDECPAPELDFKNYDLAKVERDEIEHRAKLKDWLIRSGYPGKNTGKVISFGVGDGCAQYMLAEGKTSCLIHLPYGDAYEYRDVQYLPKAEILRRAEAAEDLAKLFFNKAHEEASNAKKD